MTRLTEKYIFECKLANQPVCFVVDVANGLYADFLEENKIWKKSNDSRYDFQWIALYPMIIDFNGKHELSVGDAFTIYLNEVI